MKDLFRNIANRHTSEIALIFGKQSATYQELDILSNKIAQLIIESGLAPMECPFIGLYSSRTFYTIPMMLGIWKAGFAYVPMDPKLSTERIDYILDDCKLSVILTDTDCNTLSAKYPHIQWITINESILKAVSPAPISVQSNAYAYVIYTSGTTGRPKGSPITQAGLRNLIEARQQLIPPAENTLETSLASIVFDYSIWEIFCPMMTGTPVYFLSEQERNNPQLIAELLEKRPITTFSITPTHLSVVPFNHYPHLKYLTVAGESCPEPLIRKWQKLCKVINAYGPTETTVVTVAGIMTPDGPANDIGMPFQGVSCYILDEHLHQIPQGERGELYIGGIQLSGGYLNNEELNKQKFVANPYADQNPSAPILYASGDLVYQQPNGHIIYCGRKDSQVKIRGFRIELGEVKTALEKCESVESATVEAAEQGGQKYLRAFVKASVTPFNPAQLREELKGKLPHYMIPSRIIEVEAIPKTINGKADFQALAAMIPSEQLQDDVCGDVERKIAAIWHHILGDATPFDSDSDFIGVGGDSISIILMTEQIREKFNIHITIEAVYSHLKLRQLAAFIGSTVQRGDNISSSSQAIDLKAVPLSYYLQNVYVHCQLNQQASLAYNLVELIPFGVSLNKERLLTAWNKLIQIQDAFRTTFYTDSTGKYYMRVNDVETLTDIPEYSIADDEAARILVTERLSRPYDLKNGPLYFIELYHDADGRYLLAVYTHHLISDGWSLDELSKQLYALYEKKEVTVTGSFANYVFDTYEKEQSSLGTDSKQYWDHYLQDIPDLKLQGFNTDSDNTDYATGCVCTRMDAALSEAIQQYCSRHHVTLFSFLSSAFMLIISRISRQQQFTIGYPSSGRSSSTDFDIVGYYVHPYPLKFESSLFDLTFCELCSHTMKDISKAATHPYALVKLPSFNFTLEEKRYETNIGVNLPYQLAPLTLTIDSDEQDLQCRWLYRQSMAEQKDVELLNRCYLALLQNIINDNDQHTLRSVSMIDKSEYDRQVSLNTLSPLSMPKETIIDVFLRQVEQYPNHLALKDEIGSYTYQQLNEVSCHLAAALMSDGLPQGAVGIYCERSSQSLATILGIVRAGCFYVPLNDSYPKERLRHIMTDSGMQRIVTTRNMQKDIEGLVQSVHIYYMEDMLEGETNIMSHPEITPSTPAYMIYTSGTTGQPKGVIVPHGSVVSMVTTGALGVYCPTADDRIIQFSTYIFDASVIDIFCTLLTGATLITAPESMKKDPERLFQLMEEEQITWACIPPAFLHSCHKDPTSSLKTILVGGESPSQEIISRYRNIRFINGYGPTENTVCSTSHTYSQDTTQDSNCIGKPLQGVTCYVLDDDHNLVPDGVVGELYLGGLQLASGYHNRPELNEKCFITNPFANKIDLKQDINTRLYATGDMVCRKADGLLYFMGRKDFQIKLRGYRIELAEIENTLQNHPDVQQCVVEVRQMGDTNQLVAHIETANSLLTAAGLRTWLSEKLTAYMIPAYWSFSDHFPLTHNGKIDRTRLPEPQPCATGGDNNEELLEVERRCRFAISTIVGIEAEDIDVNANLMEEIGMNSLQILEYVSLMQARGYQIHAADVYHCKTIRKLTDFMESNKEPLTQEQIDGRVIYFSTPDNRHKPLLIVCSGTPYFEAFYMNLHRVFKDQYTILVIETASEFYSLNPDFPIDMDALMAEYARILRPILKDRTTPILTTGLCLGGDMALRLAVELDKENIARPSAIIIDGFAGRSKYGADWGGMVVEPGISEDVVKFRNHVLHTLSGSFIQRHYSGPAHLIMCTDFEDAPGQTREEAIAHFPVNKANWKEAQPDMPITFVNSVHMQMVHDPENLRIVKQIVDRYAFG